MQSSFNLAVLSTERHGGLMWKRYTSYQFARHQLRIPLAEAEIAQAAAWLPVAFVFIDNSWQAVALCSLDESTNYLIDDQGRWRSPYVPSALRGHPFGIRPEQPDQLCIDETAEEVIDQYDAEPFFNQNGDLANFPKQVHAFLQQRLRSCQTLSLKVAMLDQAALLMPWQPDEYTGAVPLYRIDEKKWNRQTGKDIAGWWKKGLVPAVYAHMMSLPNLQTLKLRQRSPQAGQAQVKTATDSPLSDLREAMATEQDYHWPTL
ncbi:MAG: SapC family protein [Halomonas sp.]|nr:SapC family protein [Halomonas sp.]MBR2513959.1 SapC family protein [Halomonas sp.]